MKLSELDVHVFDDTLPDGSREFFGLAFLCPCCQKEYLTCFFKETSYEKQKQFMSMVVSDPDAATWVPSPQFIPYAYTDERLDRITIRPAIDASPLGHARVTISHGNVIH